MNKLCCLLRMNQLEKGQHPQEELSSGYKEMGDHVKYQAFDYWNAYAVSNEYCRNNSYMDLSDSQNL